MERAVEGPAPGYHAARLPVRMKCLACNGGGLVSGVPSTKKRTSCRRCNGSGIETDWMAPVTR